MAAGLRGVQSDTDVIGGLLDRVAALEGLIASRTSGRVISCTSGTRPTTGLYRGLTIFETDTGNLLVYYGATTGWRPPWLTSWGYVDRVAPGGAGALNSVGAVTTAMSRNVVVPTNRWTLVTVQGSFFPTTGTESVAWRIMVGGSQTKLVQVNCTIAGAYHGFYIATLVQLAADGVTVDITFQKSGAGTRIDIDATTAAPELVVLDAGPAGNAPSS